MAEETAAATPSPETTQQPPETKAAPEVPKVATNILADAKAGEAAPEAKEAATEAKPEAGEKKPEETKEKPAFKAEDYKFKLPEGVDAESPLISAFASVAAEEGISPEAAQKVADKVAPLIAEAERKPYEAWKNLQETWQAEVQNDPDIGGAKLESTVAGIAKVIDRFGGPDGGTSVRLALETTGAGNNPALIRLLANISKAVNESAPVKASGPPAAKSAAEIFYPNQA